MKSTLSQIKEWVKDSELVGNPVEFSGISTDTRTLPSGALFVALRGENFDAHDFLKDISRRAAAVLAERLPADYPLPALLVPNTRTALGEIAKNWRKRFSVPLIAVTGSNGKTTVKEMIACILKAALGKGHFLATQGNLNNEVGVPMTIFRLNEEHRACVVELGMNHAGEIAALSEMAQPTVALINNAQREHQEFMRSVEAVAKENGSAINFLPENGISVFPADDEYTPLWREISGEKGVESLTFGFSAGADVTCDYRRDGWNSAISLDVMGRKKGVLLQASGLHNVRNALAAAACCHAIGIDLETIALGLESFVPVHGRMQRKKNENGVVVIDDTYNANPDSVLAAIEVLASANSPRILVLGDMGEVGESGDSFHEEVGGFAKSMGINVLLTLGNLSVYSAEAFGDNGIHCEDMPQLISRVKEFAVSGATVLVKGSRFMRMERVVSALLDNATEGNR